MRFDEIIEINNNITKLKNENKLFTFEVGCKLIDNLNITNKIIDKQNLKLNSWLINNGEFDGYEYIIKNNDLLETYNKLSNEDVECNLVMLNDTDIKDSLLDLTTIDLIRKIIKINK